MTPEPPALARARVGGVTGRVMRCLSVSVLTTALSLATLAVLTTSLALTAWVSNVVATAIGTVVSYRLNRRWVWNRHDASDPWREVVPFWVLSFAGFLLSTVAVAAADRWAQAIDLTGGPRTFAVLAASVAGYAVLWIAQFVVLERVVFANRSARDTSSAIRPAGPAPQPVMVPPRAHRGRAPRFELHRPTTKERVR